MKGSSKLKLAVLLVFIILCFMPYKAHGTPAQVYSMLGVPNVSGEFRKPVKGVHGNIGPPKRIVLLPTVCIPDRKGNGCKGK